MVNIPIRIQPNPQTFFSIARHALLLFYRRETNWNGTDEGGKKTLKLNSPNTFFRH